MAFSTLDSVRTASLNVELGLDSDSDNRFGTTSQRNYAIQEALRRLWPRMARLTRESANLTADTHEYTLTTVRDVVRIELLDEDGFYMGDLRSNWRVWYDEEDATPVVRLLLASDDLDEDHSLRVMGYAPYTVPASGGASLDLQPEDEWVIIAGARALLYRRMLNRYILTERNANENRATALTPDQVLGMVTAAERDFERGIQQHPRRIAKVKLAIPTR